MGTPRTKAGFEKAISELEAKIDTVDQTLDSVEVGSEEETDAIQEKANLSIELETLKQKFEEFLLKGEQPEDEDQATETKPEESKEAMSVKKPEPAVSVEERKWPEAMYVRASAKADWVVDPYTHVKITQEYKKVVVNNWLKAQLKAGVLIEMQNDG